MPLQPTELTGLIRVLKYYAFFRYAATLDDIYIAYPYKVSRRHMDLILRTAVAEKRILTEDVAGTSYYTLPPQGIAFHEIERKIKTANEKLAAVNLFLSVARYLAPVYLIGLSGSLAMKNSGKNDDVDFFVISAPGQVWTVRILLLLLTTLLGLRRKRGVKNAPGKVCLNLFFDGSDLAVPDHKRTLYIAHEIAHMKPQIVKNSIYERFLEANSWVYTFLPNMTRPQIAPQTAHYSQARLDPLSSLLELLFKKLQQKIIAKHLTNELVSNTQMWFYPDDFERKMKNML